MYGQATRNARRLVRPALIPRQPMALASELEIGLRVFGLDLDTSKDRALVWQALGPQMETISRDLVLKLADSLPGLSSTLRTIENAVVETITRCTCNLFLKPYDDRWIQESLARINFEQESGFDIRARSAVNRAILSALSGILVRKYRFAAATVGRLMDVASRVLLHDCARSPRVITIPESYATLVNPGRIWSRR